MKLDHIKVGVRHRRDLGDIDELAASEGHDLSQSNSLIDLAHRIKTEHEAVSVALKDSVRHAIVAGELLIEAKAQLKHGQWLPWLRDHCTISERTAQLYMRVAKNREEVEKQIRNGVADLSLNEAAAMLMLTSEVRKLLEFAGNCDGMSGEEIIQAALDQRIALMGVNRNTRLPSFCPLHAGG